MQHNDQNGGPKKHGLHEIRKLWFHCASLLEGRGDLNLVPFLHCAPTSTTLPAHIERATVGNAPSKLIQRISGKMLALKWIFPPPPPSELCLASLIFVTLTWKGYSFKTNALLCYFFKTAGSSYIHNSFILQQMEILHFWCRSSLFILYVKFY